MSRSSLSREQFPDRWGGVRRDEGRRPHRSPAFICALKERGAFLNIAEKCNLDK